MNRQGVFSSHRAYAQGVFPDEAILLLKSLAPHFVRALQLQRQIQRAELLSGGLKLVLDHFPTAVFLLDDASRLQHMNTSATELLARASQPFQITNGRLRTNDAPSNAQLARCITQAAGIASGRASAAVPILRLHRNGSDFAVMAAPLRPTAHSVAGTNPLVAVFVSTPELTPLIDSERLMQQFNLTGAEAWLASSLLTGASLADVAEMRGRSVETLRTLLKRIFVKTETRSQAQVIGVLERSLARLRR